MKKLLFSLMALALLGVSCQQELDYAGRDSELVTIGIDVPELGVTRAGESGENSALGAIDNFSDDEWAKYDVRYILEIYDVTPGWENTATPIKERMVKALDKYEPVKFDLRLIPNRDYKFVVWADFVKQGSAAVEDKLTIEDLNYNTADLHNITRIGDVKPMDESMDAYFSQVTYRVTPNFSETITLTRPFGKLRVVTTDIDEVNIGTTPTTVNIKFQNCDTYTNLNAITGKVETSVQEVSYSYTIAKDAPYTLGYDSKPESQTLFADYIFATPIVNGAQDVNFTMEIIDQNNRVIRSHDFSTSIPLSRNHLTTIIGNLLTTSSEFEILIDDNFENEENDPNWNVNIWDGKVGEIPAANAEGVIEIAEPAQFAALLASDYRGKKVALTKDIDFGGYELSHGIVIKSDTTPFVFDGQGHTVANFKVTEGRDCGLFSALVSATVKNLVIKNAVVGHDTATRASSDVYAGALVGYTMAACNFENIKVINCEVQGVNKVGGLIGNAAENYPLSVKNCSVEDSKVYTLNAEDGGCVGGFIGYIVPNATIEGCAVKNTTIEAINSANEAKRANAEFIGAFHGNGKKLVLVNNTLEANTFTEAETSYVTPETFGAWLGGIRIESKANEVTVDGKSLLIKTLDTPAVKAEAKGKVITLSWEAVENAATYSVACGAEEAVVVESTSYVFEGEYATEYKFTVVAYPVNTEEFIASEPAVITATTEREALATPVAKAEVEGNVVTLTWAAVENAAQYGITVGTEMPVFVEDTTYVFTGEYETEYTFNVVAVPADEEKFAVSEAAEVTATTGAAPVLYTTVADFLAAAEDDTEYTLKGTITSVANSTYGNFDLTDETGTVYIYGLCSPEGAQKYWAESGAKLGDDIVIKTVRTSFNGTAQGKNATFVELITPGTLAFYTVSTAAVDFASIGGMQVVNVVAYNTDATVTATSDNSAFAVNVDGYNVTISAAANELEENVTGNITIKVGDLAETVVKATLAAKPVSGSVEGGQDDFNTISATNTSYVNGKTKAGWEYKSCSILKGGTSDANPAFKMIGDASNRALCMNGKTSAKGSITSPTFSTGCGLLKFNYGLPFSDTKIKFTVEIIQNGAVVKTFTVDKPSASKLTMYSFEENVKVSGEFQIVFKNLSPSNSTSNKDRTAIWDVEWTGFNN